MGWGTRVVALTAVGLVAAGAGYAVAAVRADQPVTSRVTSPVPAVSPAYPQDSAIPLDADPSFAPLGTGLTLVPQHFGSPKYGFAIGVPQGWTRVATGDISDEWLLRPVDAPRNSYVIRIKLSTNQRSSVQRAVQQRLDALSGALGIGRFDLVREVPNGFDATYIDLSNDHAFQRFTAERFPTVPPSTYAQVEIAGTSRLVDQAAMTALVEQVALSVSR